MLQAYEPQPGTPVAELDTPCLILDMDALDHNMDVIADFYADRHSKLRGHSKNHKSPAIALRPDPARRHHRRGVRRQGRRG